MFVMVGVLFGRLPMSKFGCLALFGNGVFMFMFIYDVVLIPCMLCILILMQSLLNIHETIHFDTITTQDFPTLTSQR